jgi:hypothetical protein
MSTWGTYQDPVSKTNWDSIQSTVESYRWVISRRAALSDAYSKDITLVAVWNIAQGGKN